MDGAELAEPARAILHSLLDRYEQPGRRQVVRVRLNEREHGAYFSTSDVTPRRATNLAFARLAQQQVLVLHWRRWEEGNWLSAVDLRLNQADVIYQLLGRAPRAMQEDALRTLLSAQTPRAEWHAAFLHWALDQIDGGRNAPPLERNDPQGSAELLRALAGLASLKAPTLERTLSVRLFADSKRLAQLRGGLLRVLRRHDRDAPLYGDDDEALLRSRQLERAPEYIPLAGSLTLSLPSSASPQSLAPFAPSLALPASLLRTASVVALEARVVLTVENLTSFSELCATRPPEILAIYSGGFASPTLISLLRALRQAAPAVAFWHWGDIDAGGLRILAHLRAKLGPVQALAMDCATLAGYSAAGQALSDGDRIALSELRAHPLLSDCGELIAQLLSTGTKLEQEAVLASVALSGLR